MEQARVEDAGLTCRGRDAGLRDVTIDYDPPAGAVDDQGPAFSLVELTTSLPFGIERLGSDKGPQALVVKVRYVKQSDSVARSAVITFKSNDQITPSVSITVTTDVGVPRLSATPNPVDFQLVPRSDTPIYRTLTLLNTGNRVLNVSGFRVEDDVRFGVRGDGFELTGEDAANGIDLAQAIQVEPGANKTVEVSFLSDSPSPAEGQLVIFSDDPTSGQTGYAVDLVANKSGPCVLVTPREVDFGGKLVGNQSRIELKVESCGTEPLSLTSVAMKAGSSPDFSLDFSTLPTGYETGWSTTHPLSVPINESVTIAVVFVPDSVNPRDADNVPIPDKGTVLIGSNAFESQVQVPVEGAGSDVECPTPVIVVEEGEEVIPETVLHLDATQSYAPFGGIAAYEWRVTQPEGSASVLVPSFTDPQPVLEANVVGVYTFKLDVRDENGNRSGESSACPTAEYQVLVQPDQAIHVELTWVTPGDVDETDTGEGVGSDLDLHFAHESARGPDLDGDGFPDPWFDESWDVFWFYPEQQWGSFDPNARDNPTLDRDDTDGAGPENLNLAVPQDGVAYTIGVHYWNDWGFGPADATVKVFHYAELVYEATLEEMQRLDMWCVGKIHWPTPAVERCAPEGQPEQVTPRYVNTFFQPSGI